MANTCKHEHVIQQTSGSVYFSAGDVVDTTHDYLVCIDCGTEIEPEPAPVLVDYLYEEVPF